MTDDYALCIYGGTPPTLIADAVLSSGAGWAQPNPTKYKFKGATADGLIKALLKSGGDGKSKVIIKGKGAALPDPAMPLGINYPLTVQLKKAGSPFCLESTFANGDEKTDEEPKYLAKKH